MSDHSAEGAIQFFLTHLTVVKIAACEGAHDINAVNLRAIEAVDNMRRLSPFFLVDRLTVVFDALGKIKSCNRPPGVPVAAAFLFCVEIQLLAAVF